VDFRKAFIMTLPPLTLPHNEPVEKVQHDD
jgi:hypothetical protein